MGVFDWKGLLPKGNLLIGLRLKQIPEGYPIEPQLHTDTLPAVAPNPSNWTSLCQQKNGILIVAERFRTSAG